MPRKRQYDTVERMQAASRAEALRKVRKLYKPTTFKPVIVSAFRIPSKREWAFSGHILYDRLPYLHWSDEQHAGKYKVMLRTVKRRM